MTSRLAANTIVTLLVVGLLANVQIGRALEIPSMSNMTDPLASSALCATELETCQEDSDCVECWNNGSPQCDTTFTSCDDVWNILCCKFGATITCASNEALFEYIDCNYYEYTEDCPARDLCSAWSGTVGSVHSSASAFGFLAMLAAMIGTVVMA